MKKNSDQNKIIPNTSNLNHQIKEEIKKIILEKFKQVFENQENFVSKLEKNTKADKTIVTAIDLFISQAVKDLLKRSGPPWSESTFYSEEDHYELSFPASIIDPIDGTIELAKGFPECAFSGAFMQSPELDDTENWGIVFNPFTGFDISSHSYFQKPIEYSKPELLGLVSRTEWNDNVFKGYQEQLSSKVSSSLRISIIPKGSIAFKLGLLAAGSADFVVSFRPKNIWDIAAGTILCHLRGYSLFEGKNQVKSLDRQQYFPPLYWCRPELLPFIAAVQH